MNWKNLMRNIVIGTAFVGTVSVMAYPIIQDTMVSLRYSKGNWVEYPNKGKGIDIRLEFPHIVDTDNDGVPDLTLVRRLGPPSPGSIPLTWPLTTITREPTEPEIEFYRNVVQNEAWRLKSKQPHYKRIN